MLHAIVTSDWHLEAMKKFFPRDGVKRQLHEIDKIYKYAIKKGIKHVFVPGDIADTPHMDWDTVKQLIELLKRYDGLIHTYYIAGNHDFSDIKRTSLDVLDYITKNGFFRTFHLYLDYESIEIDGVKTDFLPYPCSKARESDVPTLNFAHIDADGAIGDNGRRMKVHDDYESPDSHFTVSGHIHQHQYIEQKRLLFCGNPYQKNYGETEDRGFIEIKAKPIKDRMVVKFKRHRTRPAFKLINLMVEQQEDLAKISANPLHFHKIWVDPSVVLPNNFRVDNPNITDVLDIRSKKKITLEETEQTQHSTSMQISPMTGLKDYLKAQGFTKKKAIAARDEVVKAATELGINMP